MGLLSTAAAQRGSFREIECTTGVPLCTELVKGKSTLRVRLFPKPTLSAPEPHDAPVLPPLCGA